MTKTCWKEISKQERKEINEMIQIYAKKSKKERKEIKEIILFFAFVFELIDIIKDQNLEKGEKLLNNLTKK